MVSARQAWAATHGGHVRPTNEDRCCVGSWFSDGRNASWHGLVDCDLGWAVIADGMGGHDAGELASESVVRTIMGLAAGARSEADLARMLALANNHIYEQMYGGRGRPAMGSTVVGVVFRGQRALMFNVGDSRLYLTLGSELNLESVDDRLARVSPNRTVRSHALTQSLGGTYSQIPLTPHVKHRVLSGREGLLLCSDGLTDMLSDEEIAEILLSQPTHPAQALVSAALDAGGLDSEGDLVLIELKRDRTPREIVAQVLDYASWVAALKTPQIHEIARGHLNRSLESAFREQFDAGLPDTLNSNHTLVIVASALDSSSQRIVRYLAEVHDIAINTAFFNVFINDGDTLLATDWLLDQAEVEERSQTKTKAPWSGLWYVNVGESEHRSWEDMRRFGFIAAGGGQQWSAPLQRLQSGDRIIAYQKQAGYVGYGTVSKTAVMARNFETPNGPLLDQPLAQPGLARERDNPENAEYTVGVDWIRTVPVDEAKWLAGLFANQNIVCKLRDGKTLNFLKDQFGIAEA